MIEDQLSVAGPVRIQPARARRSWTAAGYWGFALAVFYAVFVRFGQAAGITIGLPGTMTAEARQSFPMASYRAGLFVLLAGVALLVLVVPRARVLPRWLPAIGGTSAPRALVAVVLVLPVLVGSVVGTAHGTTGILSKSLHLMGVVAPHGLVSLYASTTPAMDWWDILFYEPWFVLIGVCAGLSALAWAYDSRVRPATIRIGVIVYAVAAVALTSWEIVTVLSSRILVIG
jgi:hypothetical protein